MYKCTDFSSFGGAGGLKRKTDNFHDGIDINLFCRKVKILGVKLSKFDSCT